MNSSLTRRKFLYLLFASLLLKDGESLASGLSLRQSGTDKNETNPELLCEMFTHRMSAVAIGQAYLEQQPSPLKPQNPFNDLLKDSPRLLPSLQKRKKSQIRQILLSKHQNDFFTGSVVNVQGWVLSKTEARLCAIASQLDR